MDLEKFDSNILELCCGEGHMSEVLKAAGYNVTPSDLINRGYGKVKSLFDYEHFNGNVILLVYLGKRLQRRYNP